MKSINILYTPKLLSMSVESVNFLCRNVIKEDVLYCRNLRRRTSLQHWRT